MAVRRIGMAALSLLSLGSPAAFAAADGSIVLAPHRAVYDLSLLSSKGSKGVDSVQGRIAFSFAGDACDGYTLEFRQVTVLGSGETGNRTSDLRTTTFEDGDGKLFRFKSEARRGSGGPILTDGTASREDAAWRLTLKQPQPEKLDLTPEALAPSAHMRRVIAAARAGERIVAVPVFDGSDDGKKVYDTLSVIGAPIEDAPAEEPARQDKLKNMRRWPVTISYFAPGQGERVPAYKMSFDLYDNGISGALKIDYETFTVRAELKQLELLEASACKK